MESIAIVLMHFLQTEGINSSEFIAPQVDCLIANSDFSLDHEIVDVPMTEIDAVIELDRVLNDGRREAATRIDSHGELSTIVRELVSSAL